jgi:hypothetical protein
MRFLYFLVFWAYITSLQGQVVINEYSASNLKDFRDDFGKTEDWIELYNKGNAPVNISGWFLSDKADKPKKWKIPAGTIIPPSGFLLFWASGRDITTDTSFHTNFKFTQSKNDEFVVLANASGTILESSPLILTQVGHSIAKDVDGSNKWRICTIPTPNGSNTDTPMFTQYSTKPKITTNPGFYKDSVVVVIEGNDLETIRYSLDGDLPNDESPEYIAPLVIKKTAVLSVRSFSTNENVHPGFTDFATFFINEPSSTLPIISIGAGQMVIDLANGNRDLEPIGSCEVFTKNGTLTSRSYGELDRHGQDSWVNDQRSLDWISRDEMGQDNGLKQKLFSYSQRDEYQRIILRASGDDNYPSVDDGDHEGSTHIRDEYVHTLVQKAGMHMDVRALERYLVYLNGRYWGVYTIREKPDDHDYTDFTYKQDKFDLQFLKTWGGTWVEYGEDKALQDWIEFKDFVLDNDVSQDSVYQRIDREFDVISLMDYMIANLTCVSSDWLNYNTGWWRGLNDKGGHKKWGYIMWDNDATFDYYINYSGVPNTSSSAKACDINDISDYMDEFFPADTTLVELPADSFFIDGEWQYFEGDTFTVYPDPGKHEKIFLKLLDNNETFRNLYFARYADMLSTTFSCTSMLAILDSLVNIIKPEMPRHIQRWSGTMSEWNRNIKRLRDYVVKRCDRVSDGLVDCYDLSGPHQITITTDPPNAGKIKFNTISHSAFPWSGNYFGNMVNKIEVLPSNNRKFLHWKSQNGKTNIKQPLSLLSDLSITDTDTLIAVFEGAVSTFDVQELGTMLYPNPATQYVEIDFENEIGEDMKIQLITTDGKSMMLNPEFTDQNKIKININHIQSGSYMLRIQTSQGLDWHKLIIMK